MKLTWKQNKSTWDYELMCPCCKQNIADVLLREGTFFATINAPKKEYGVARGHSFKAVRAIVNKRIEELLNK